tara:strand:+ start:75 stop:464 length:390 start_codon:yes stop_codon:yes gene_type:complete
VIQLVGGALFFSFVGTILGGIWADQSWGRFWGWDPKENGALLIVLWNAAILHTCFITRNALIIFQMAIFGNVVTTFSWFGVNLMGVGLHSYGWLSGSLMWIIVFSCIQIICIVLASIRFRWMNQNIKKR